MKSDLNAASLNSIALGAGIYVIPRVQISASVTILEASASTFNVEKRIASAQIVQCTNTADFVKTYYIASTQPIQSIISVNFTRVANVVSSITIAESAVAEFGNSQGTNIWDTSQGVAKGYAKFQPTQDGKPFVVESIVSCESAVVAPSADSDHVVIGEHVNVSTQKVFNSVGNGYATFKTKSSVIGFFNPRPSASSNVVTIMHGFTAYIYKPQLNADAAPMTAGADIQSDLGNAYPWGIKNPSDEELITIILKSRKSRQLTSNYRYGITRA